MQAVVRQQSQTPRKAQQDGPLLIKPELLSKPLDHDRGRDILYELPELTKGSHLKPQHVPELYTQRHRASWSTNFTLI